jgi:hypothetical protein
MANKSQHDKEKSEKEKLDKKLDEALEDTFPDSDPVAISEPAPADPKPGHKKP